MSRTIKAERHDTSRPRATLQEITEWEAEQDFIAYCRSPRLATIDGSVGDDYSDEEV